MLLQSRQFTNILKYADASMTTVSLKRQNGELIMSVKDDGKGFDTRMKRTGIGLENIKRRTQVLNGHLRIISAPGKGCDLIVHIPFD